LDDIYKCVLLSPMKWIKFLFVYTIYLCGLVISYEICDKTSYNKD